MRKPLINKGTLEMIPAIEKSVQVPLAPSDAFRVFTSDIALWWPLDTHSLSAQNGQSAQSVAVEPRIGGKIVETKPDGSTADWATITDWTPGARLSFDWYVGRDPSEATQIRITFMANDNGTRVDLIHDGFDRLGAQGVDIARGYQTGWDGVLGQCYVSACQRKAA